MAQFRICFVNSANVTIEDVIVTGAKEPDYKVAKVNGSDVAKKYDYYYVRKPNAYGIKWVIMNKNDWRGNDISSNKTLPHYSKIAIYKLY